ncbi:patatin-like phospholipase family protein [Caldimonas tepidiphila]|uniref:patatin-like phospholipase family protein n=1 Tax=Caldimonas tepidiphila TaxID=2315841 RepID=UPI000E5A468A|nr:patatin-like phospholipase family protein [Caldimonas tepidiphila]
MDGKPRIGVALGSGSARGWAHIGVLRVLQEAGLEPQVVCGTSIGSLVGAACVAGELDRLEAWVRSLTWQAVVGMLDLTTSGGLIKGRALTEFFRRHFRDRDIQTLDRTFGAVATQLTTGQEVWLQSGSLIDAVRASMAFPGLLTPAQDRGRLLVDGGLVNPVPVSLCRALGADLVVAVDLNSDLLGRHLRPPARPEEPAPANGGPLANMLDRLQSGLGRLRSGPSHSSAMPSIVDVLASSVNIMQVRITRSRLAGEPADILIQPRLAQMAFMDFHRGAAAIAEGRRAAREALPQFTQFGLG